ncbi:hypothetical protein [Pseudonocardia xishanensis]|uniref:Uncharacterized protein n=1 Tax=Pseudonocardia xishanensis TaxID=630995 RepID=A0ABP8S361_9PSEU
MLDDSPRQLTDDQIDSTFLLPEDIAREAVGLARGLVETADRAPDDVVAVPAAEFRTLVRSLGMMHKTLIESLRTRVGEPGTAPPDGSAGGALSLAGRLLKAQNGAALTQAKLLVDAVGETAAPAAVEVPAHAAKAIADAVILTSGLLESTTFAQGMPGAAGPIVVGYSDTGDRGFMSNWYNFGNIND